MTSPEISPRDLRVSDAEREHTLRLLERATGRGLIDIDEYSDRSTKVITAKTRADLNSLLIDLPGLQIAGRPYDPSEPMIPAAPSWPQTGAWGTAGGIGASGSSGQPADVMVLRGYGSRQFTGHWTVPSLITVAGTGANTKLDFTQAQLTSRVVTVEFQSNMGGSVYLRVPAGTAVHYERLDMRGCSIKNHLRPTAGPVPMTLHLVGMKRYGTVTIRGPKQSGLRRLLDGINEASR